METVFVLVTIIMFTIANSLHVIVAWCKNTPGFVFNGIAHSFPDYFLYLSHVAQGAHGTLILTHHQFTDEVLPPTALYWFYSLVGYIGHFAKLTIPWSYNVSLLLVSTIVIYLWYLLTRRLYPTQPLRRLTTFFVIISASPFINLQKMFTQEIVEFPKFLWFSPTPAFNRLGGVPHQIMQTILILTVLFLFSHLMRIRPMRPMSLIGLMFLSFIATYSQPLQMILLLAACGIVALSARRFIPIIAATIGSIPAALLVNYEYTTPIYAVGKLWESSQQTPTGFFWWIATIGPIALFVPFGIKLFLKKADILRLTFFIYGALSFIGYNSPLPKLLGITAQRFLHPASYALFPVLAVSGFFAIRKNIPKSFQNIFVVLITLFYLMFTIPANIEQVRLRIHDPSFKLVAYLNHTPAAIVDGLKTIDKQPANARHTVVLADERMGIDFLIPTYTGHPSFMGQALHTLYPDVKDGLQKKFFSGAMTPIEEKQFFQNHRIGYLITDPSKQTILSHIPYLTKIFENSAMTIYSVH